MRHQKLPGVVDRPSGSIFAEVFDVHLDERYHCGPDSPWGTSVQGAGSKGVRITEGFESAAWTRTPPTPSYKSYQYYYALRNYHPPTSYQKLILRALRTTSTSAFLYELLKVNSTRTTYYAYQC